MTKRRTPTLRDQLIPGLRRRRDGWTDTRLQRFLDALKQTGCIRDAARAAGVSAKSAYDLERRFPAFAAAMKDALDRSQTGLLATAHKFATVGRETVIIRKGEEVERRIVPDAATLGLLIKRGDNGTARDHKSGKFSAAAQPVMPYRADEVLTFAESQAGWTFDDHGKKHISTILDEAHELLIRKLDEMAARTNLYDGGAAR